VSKSGEHRLKGFLVIESKRKGVVILAAVLCYAVLCCKPACKQTDVKVSPKKTRLGIWPGVWESIISGKTAGGCLYRGYNPTSKTLFVLTVL